MNWIILIIAGLFEVAFAACLGKAKESIGTVILGIVVFDEPATFWRLFFISTLIISIVGLKVVAN